MLDSFCYGYVVVYILCFTIVVLSQIYQNIGSDGTEVSSYTATLYFSIVLCDCAIRSFAAILDQSASHAIAQYAKTLLLHSAIADSILTCISAFPCLTQLSLLNVYSLLRSCVLAIGTVYS